MRAHEHPVIATGIEPTTETAVGTRAEAGVVAELDDLGVDVGQSGRTVVDDDHVVDALRPKCGDRARAGVRSLAVHDDGGDHYVSRPASNAAVSAASSCSSM